MRLALPTLYIIFFANICNFLHFSVDIIIHMMYNINVPRRYEKNNKGGQINGKHLF